MGKIFKTREVSERLGISPKTIRTWVKKHNIPYGSNDLGHYLYNEDAIKMLAEVKSEVMESEYSTTKKQPTQSQSNIDNKLEKILERLDSVELELTKKADDIVSVQVLQHRSEIDEILERLDRIEEKINNSETEKIKHFSDYKPIEEKDMISLEKSKKNWLMSLFSF